MDENTEYTKRLGFKIKEKKKTLPIMYWIPEMHKNSIGACFIIASKICSKKQISKSVSNAFKLAYSKIEHFHKNSKFLPNYNKFWVSQNSDPIIQSLNNIIKKNMTNPLQHITFSHYTHSYLMIN